ncbi:MAG: C45 family autoproteolytic acyltransferase/hydrolase [Kiritimatiellia bacterium]
MSATGGGQPGQSGPHQFYEWRGAAYEVGFQHGQALRAEIVAETAGVIESFARDRCESESAALEGARLAWEPLFREHVPRVLEEIRGLADGGGFAYDWMFFAALHGGTKAGPALARNACTAFACGPTATRDGAALMGQTKDTSAPLSRYRIIRLLTSDGPARVMLNYPGWITHLGLSEHGLFNTCNSLHAPLPGSDAAPLSLLRAMVSEKRSVDEVLRAIRGALLRQRLHDDRRSIGAFGVHRDRGRPCGRARCLGGAVRPRQFDFEPGFTTVRESATPVAKLRPAPGQPATASGW